MPTAHSRSFLDRLLPADVRELNLSHFTPDDLGDLSALREALSAMPFLADRRIVIVTETQTMRADPRRELWAAAQAVPEGSTLVMLDLLSAAQPASAVLWESRRTHRPAHRYHGRRSEPRALHRNETLGRLRRKGRAHAPSKALAGGTADIDFGAQRSRKAGARGEEDHG